MAAAAVVMVVGFLLVDDQSQAWIENSLSEANPPACPLRPEHFHLIKKYNSVV